MMVLGVDGWMDELCRLDIPQVCKVIAGWVMMLMKIVGSMMLKAQKALVGTLCVSVCDCHPLFFHNSKAVGLVEQNKKIVKVRALKSF